MGRLPVRDCRRSSTWSVMASPNLAEELAAYALLPRFFVGHDAAAGRQDRHAHARADARDVVVADVHAAARRGDATNAVDGARSPLAVAEDHRERLGRAVADADVVHV